MVLERTGAVRIQILKFRFLLNFAIIIICTLASVAFFTLFERKVLGLIQIRVGPSKVGFMGVLQPLGDALKLFRKIDSTPYQSNKVLYFVSPIWIFGLSILV